MIAILFSHFICGTLAAATAGVMSYRIFRDYLAYHPGAQALSKLSALPSRSAIVAIFHGPAAGCEPAGQ